MSQLDAEDRDQLAVQLHDCWPLLFNDGLQMQVAKECIDFLNDRLSDKED